MRRCPRRHNSVRLTKSAPGHRAPGLCSAVEVALTLNELRAHFEGIIATNEKFYQQRYDFDQNATKAALEANDKRLNSMNEFRLALSDQTSRMITRQEVMALVDAMQERGGLARDNMGSRLEAKIVPLEQRVNQFGKTNWPLLVSFSSLLFVAMSVLWLVFGLKIDTATAPLTLTVEALKSQWSSLTVQTSERIANREAQVREINRQLSTLSTDLQVARQDLASFKATQGTNSGRLTSLEQGSALNLADRRAGQAAVTQKLVEIETQFKAMSIVLNLMKDDNHQMIGVLWSKSFPGVPLPPKSFRPALYQELPMAPP